MDLVTRMRLCAEDLHCINPTSEAVKCLSLGADAIDKLQYRVVELGREVAQWKNNHATVVAQARILKERDDMPIERVKTYETWQRATAERDALAAQVEVMREALGALLGCIRETRGSSSYIAERNARAYSPCPAPCPKCAKCAENASFRLLAVEHANVTANEALRYQKSIRDLQAKASEQRAEIAQLIKVRDEYLYAAAGHLNVRAQQVELITELDKTIAKQYARIAELEQAVAFNDQTSRHYLTGRTEALQQVYEQAAEIARLTKDRDTEISKRFDSEQSRNDWKELCERRTN